MAYIKYINCMYRRNAWCRLQLDKKNLSILRIRLTLHVGLISRFMASVAHTTVSKIESMLQQGPTMLQKKSSRQSMLSVQTADAEAV